MIYNQFVNHNISNNQYINCIPTNSKKRKRVSTWTLEEENKLIRLVGVYGKKWSLIASYFENKTNYQCFYHFSRNLNLKLNEWSEEEDKKMIIFLKKNGICWRICGEYMNKKSNECFERYKILKKKWLGKRLLSWKMQDELKLLLFVSNIGKCWDKIRLCFPGKSKSTICRKFYSLMRNHIKNKKNMEEIDDSSLVNLMKYLPSVIYDTKINILKQDGGNDQISEVLIYVNHYIKKYKLIEKEINIIDSFNFPKKNCLDKKKEDLKALIKQKLREKLYNVLKQQITNIPPQNQIQLNSSKENVDIILNKIHYMKSVLQNVNMAIKM